MSGDFLGRSVQGLRLPSFALSGRLAENLFETHQGRLSFISNNSQPIKNKRWEKLVINRAPDVPNSLRPICSGAAASPTYGLGKSQIPETFFEGQQSRTPQI